jgi:hypothetical protein
MTDHKIGMNALVAPLHEATAIEETIRLARRIMRTESARGQPSPLGRNSPRSSGRPVLAVITVTPGRVTAALSLRRMHTPVRALHAARRPRPALLPSRVVHPERRLDPLHPSADRHDVRVEPRLAVTRQVTTHPALLCVGFNVLTRGGSRSRARARNRSACVGGRPNSNHRRCSDSDNDTNNARSFASARPISTFSSNRSTRSGASASTPIVARAVGSSRSLAP